MLQVQIMRRAFHPASLRDAARTLTSVSQILPTLVLLKNVKQLCLKMYLNDMSLREIDHLTYIHHTTI